MHVRGQIKNRVKDVIKGAYPFKDNVLLSTDVVTPESPVAIISILDESAEQITQGENPLLQRTAELTIEVRAKKEKNRSFDEILDEAAAQIESKLGQDLTLNRLIKRIILTRSTLEIADDSPEGRLILTYDAVYMTNNDNAIIAR